MQTVSAPSSITVAARICSVELNSMVREGSMSTLKTERAPPRPASYMFKCRTAHGVGAVAPLTAGLRKCPPGAEAAAEGGRCGRLVRSTIGVTSDYILTVLVVCGRSGEHANPRPCAQLTCCWSLSTASWPPCCPAPHSPRWHSARRQESKRAKTPSTQDILARLRSGAPRENTT